MMVLTALLRHALCEAGKVRLTRHDGGMSDLILIAQCIGKATAAEADRGGDKRNAESW